MSLLGVRSAAGGISGSAPLASVIHLFSLYSYLARNRFLSLLAYRANFWTGIVIYLVYFGSYYYLWKAVFEAGGERLGGLSFPQMAAYLGAGWMGRSFWFNNLDREIAREVREGSLALQLIRPYSYLGAKVVEAWGEGLFRFAFYALPGLLLAALLVSFPLPASPWRWAEFASALFVGFFINSFLNCFFGLLSFFFLRNEGFLWAKRVAVDVLSGVFLPLDLYPGFLRSLLPLLPFSLISYFPNRAFAGLISPGDFLRTLGLGLGWMLALTLGLVLLWALARRKLVIQGG